MGDLTAEQVPQHSKIDVPLACQYTRAHVAANGHSGHLTAQVSPLPPLPHGRRCSRVPSVDRGDVGGVAAGHWRPGVSVMVGGRTTPW
jgi:hypothetical protein